MLPEPGRRSASRMVRDSREFMASNGGLIDYVEIPFEQLRHSPGLVSIQETLP